MDLESVSLDSSSVIVIDSYVPCVTYRFSKSMWVQTFSLTQSWRSGLSVSHIWRLRIPTPQHPLHHLPWITWSGPGYHTCSLTSGRDVFFFMVRKGLPCPDFHPLVLIPLIVQPSSCSLEWVSRKRYTCNTRVTVETCQLRLSHFFIFFWRDGQKTIWEVLIDPSHMYVCLYVILYLYIYMTAPCQTRRSGKSRPPQDRVRISIVCRWTQLKRELQIRTT